MCSVFGGFFGQTTLAHFSHKTNTDFLPVNPIGVNTRHTRSLNKIKLNKKKGCATIFLGLNYCFMGFSQPPSCDTVPLAESCKSEKLVLSK
jgi:hypothetical protein